MKINANLTTQTDELTGSTMSPAKLEAYYFNLVTAILFTVFALIGNCLVIFVLTKPKFLEVPLFRYLIVATIVETISVSFIWASGFPNVFGIFSIFFFFLHLKKNFKFTFFQDKIYQILLKIKVRSRKFT
jgi:hypothetical protein